ncbi:MAG TPA: hypothetical protein HA222_00555 [Candidatus Diapherotrites archaeon]|uniref:Uncharacterized protein n=1 Tax=Candidatus Iainarchaeum sp. TaxID=3101447 RepID=A0A7J4JVZ6_9ARCH|nr:hypothetical protein [Candidatus Diapherotrites archaeon]
MGFWEKVLGKPRAEGKKALRLADLESLAEKSLEREKQAFLKKSSQAFETVQELVKTALENLGEIEKRDFTAEGENQYLRKIVQSSKQGFTSKMQALLEKAFPPKQKDFEKSWNYSQNALASFQQDIASARKNIAYTGILAKNEMKEFGKSIEALEKKLLELKQLSESSKIKKLESLSEQLGTVKEIHVEQFKLKERIKELGEAVKELENAKSKALESKLALEQGAVFKEFHERMLEKERLEAEKKSLREKANNLLAPLEKQLRKMQSLNESKGWVLESTSSRLLAAFLHDAFQALRQDPKGEGLKELLKELEKAIEAGKISFKDEKEKGKKMQALQELEKFDFFGEFFWKLNELDKRLSALNAELEKSTLFKELHSLEARVESAEREKAQKSKEIEMLKQNLEKQESSRKERIEVAESRALEALEEKIEIKPEN